MKLTGRYRFLLGCAACVFLVGCAGPQAFPSSGEAVDSLVTALRTNDQAKLHKVLGYKTDALVSSGDPVNDQNRIDAFLKAYDEKHSFQAASDNSVALLVGNSDWPFPIPVVKDPWQNAWHFDVDSGLSEMQNRRIGRNELDTMQTCLAIVDAQRDYAALDPERTGSNSIYAQKFISDAGKKNGLFWPTAANEPPSPLGEVFAAAAAAGYTYTAGKPSPYHGYYFRILTSQGPSAAGGAMDYLVNGKLVRGFAVLAYPAEHGNSGIMTFLVNVNGVLYSADLGDQTEKIASRMTSFDPGPNWNIVTGVDTVIAP
jgi:hypothetical protein